MRRKFNRSYAEHITSAGHVFLLAVGAKIGTMMGWLCVLCLVGGISLVLWVLNFRRVRAVADTPTSRVASAPQGYVELCGVARPATRQPLSSPLTSTPCVWYRFVIEEKRGKNWSVIERGLSDETFILDDGSGQVLVDPDWAEVMTDHYRCWTERGRWTEPTRRHSEWLLVPNDRLYAIGEFTTMGGSSTQLDAKGDVSALLAEWKKNQPDLKRRFDLDGNGQINPQEWELAVRAARREVARRHQEIRSQPGVNVMRAPGQGRLFLLSNFGPDRLARRYGLWTRAQLAIAVVAGAAAVWVMVRMALL